MFAVIFEVEPRPERWEDYLRYAGLLRPELERIEGFLENRRFRSRRHPGRLLSFSLWRDEKAVVRWRSHAGHHAVQARGRAEVFRDYHLRVGEVIADDGAALPQRRFDATEAGAARLVSLVEKPAEEAPRETAPGLVDWDMFGGLLDPADRAAPPRLAGGGRAGPGRRPPARRAGDPRLRPARPRRGAAIPRAGVSVVSSHACATVRTYGVERSFRHSSVRADGGMRCAFPPYLHESASRALGIRRQPLLVGAGHRGLESPSEAGIRQNAPQAGAPVDERCQHLDDFTGTVLAGHHQPPRLWVLCLYFMG